MFEYRRYVQFYETDLMKVVHHSNYVKFFEEARVEWLREKNLTHTHSPHADLSLGVIDMQCRYLKPAYFGDQLTVKLQLKLEGRKVRFQYAIFSDRFGAEKPITTGMTLHIPLNSDFKVCSLTPEIKQQLEKEQWTETWH